MALEHSSSERDEKNLEDNNCNPDDGEVQVVADSIENIPFVIDLSAANHVEDLEEHEQVEDSGQMSRFRVGQKLLAVSR